MGRLIDYLIANQLVKDKNPGTNGNKAGDNVNATVDISKGRSITISLADEDTECHFMGQQIYGIVKGLTV